MLRNFPPIKVKNARYIIESSHDSVITAHMQLHPRKEITLFLYKCRKNFYNSSYYNPLKPFQTSRLALDKRR